MELLKTIILGIVQGLTEFLPVSSTGHLVIFQTVLGMKEADNILLDVMLHIGTLLAVIIAFFPDVVELFKGLFGIVGGVFTGKAFKKNLPDNQKLVLLIIIATLPVVAMTPFVDLLEKTFTSIIFVGFALLFTALLLFIADRIAKGNIPLEKATGMKAFIIGIFQAVALLPGVSRSGSTITAGLFCGLKRVDAVRFAFLMSLPAVAGAAFLKIADTNFSDLNIGIMLAGMISSAIVGFFAIKLLTYVVKRDKFKYFVYYCLVVGLFSILYGIFA